MKANIMVSLYMTNNSCGCEDKSKIQQCSNQQDFPSVFLQFTLFKEKRIFLPSFKMLLENPIKSTA